jgi:hypothetical protein
VTTIIIVNCGSSSHFIKNCPQPRKSFQGQTSNPSSKGQGKKKTVQVRQGRVNFTTLSELSEGAPIMTGTFTIHHQPTVILFYSSSTHSFISPKFGIKVGLHYTKAAQFHRPDVISSAKIKPTKIDRLFRRPTQAYKIRTCFRRPNAGRRKWVHIFVG